MAGRRSGQESLLVYGYYTLVKYRREIGPEQIQEPMRAMSGSSPQSLGASERPALCGTT